jgi:hypothetical protein
MTMKMMTLEILGLLMKNKSSISEMVDSKPSCVEFFQHFAEIATLLRSFEAES